MITSTDNIRQLQIQANTLKASKLSQVWTHFLAHAISWVQS